MAGGAQSGNQSGYSNSNMNSNTTANSNTNATANSTGSNTTDSINSGSSNTAQTGGFTNGVVPTTGWEELWRSMNPSGQNAGASDYFANQLNRNSYTLGSLAAKAAAGVPGYESYLAPTPVSAQQVSDQTGAAYMGNYTGPWQDVSNSALGSYDVGADKAIGAFKAQNAGIANNSRLPLQQAALANEIGAGRGALAGQILGQGYTTAANLGSQDATRIAGIQASNADRALNAGQFNNNMQNNRSMFDVNAAYQGDQSRDSAAGNLANVNNSSSAANNAYLNTGTSLFGQQGTSYGNTASDFLNKLISNSLANTSSNSNSNTNSASNTTGNSSTNSSGNSSAKGAGFDFSKGLSALVGL